MQVHGRGQGARSVAKPGSLAEKLSGAHSEVATKPAHPALLSKVARLLLQPSFTPDALEQLAKNHCSGPFLQGLLRGLQGDG